MTVLSEAELETRAARPMSATPRPFVRWAGSKRALLTHLLKYLPREFSAYYEPFLGSGAMFFLVRPYHAVLNDSCPELMQTYLAVSTDAEHVVAAARRSPMTKQDFYRVRANRSTDLWERAGEFLYLNRGCFNGLYRVNSRGEFNVPWGRPKTSFVINRENLLAAQKLLSRDTVRLTCEDFEKSLQGCKERDFIYLDPPYVTMHNDNGFADYNEKLFSWHDQIRLAEAAQDLRRRGCHVLVTNAMHQDIISLYRGFEVHEFVRYSTLAGSAAKRRKVSEAILVSRNCSYA